MSGNPGRGNVWSRGERLLLLQVWRDEDVEGQLQGCHRNITVYTRLAELMGLQGFERTPTQCRNKLKALRGDWVKMKKNLSKSGTSGRCSGTNEEMEIMSEVLGARPIHTPTNVVDTLALTGASASVEDSTEEDDSNLSGGT